MLVVMRLYSIVWVVRMIVEPSSVSFSLKSASCVSTQLVREGGGGGAV